MKTAIFSLYQRHELAKARCFIAQAVPALSAQRELHILINDADCPDLRAHTRTLSPHIHLHCVGRNLGVAGGRNLLVRKAREHGAELLISCDTDIVYETDYFAKLTDAYLRLAEADADLGFVQPNLIDGRRVRDAIAQFAAKNWDELYNHVRSGTQWRSNLWDAVVAQRGFDEALLTLFHSGTSNIWRAHFADPPDARFPRPGSEPAWVGTYLTDHFTLRSDSPVLTRVMRDGLPVRICSTAGGISVFHVSLLDAIGSYDDIFNPFGYEDSEIGFRSMLKGRHNYLVPDVFAVHDIFMGHTHRSAMSHSRIGLLRGVEMANPLLSADLFEFASAQSLLYAGRELIKPFVDEIRSKRMTLEEAETNLPHYIASYAHDLLRGLLHGIGSRRNFASQAPLLELLRGLLDGDAEVADFRLSLGVGTSLVAGRAIARRRPGADGAPIHSVFASNCRVEESTGGSTLRSRYFDIALIVRPAGDGLATVTLDLQSDDYTYAVALQLELPTEDVAKKGSARVRDFRVAHKRYEYGLFSTEDIYPAPSLHTSTGWVPVLQAYLERLTAALPSPGLKSVVDGLNRYLLQAPSAVSTPAAAEVLRPVTSPTAVVKKRVLVFTDSRGQHKPAGGEYPIFGERLAADPRCDVDLFLCPMKWTTTLDFLASFSPERLRSYDHIVLYTGIVDWSPRRCSSAMVDLYDNKSTVNAENLALNTRDYTKKVVNNKKRIFDEVFGAGAMAEHFRQPLETEFEGEKTANMYSLEMARASLLPRLNEIPNLIFVSANRFVKGWNGDYRRQRPANITLTHAYSDLFSEGLKAAKVIDLRGWSDEEVKQYTCDNIHLTQRGSDLVYDAILGAIGLKPLSSVLLRPAGPAATATPTAGKIGTLAGAGSTPARPTLGSSFAGLRPLERFTKAKKPALLAAAKRQDFLATLVIGVRLDPADAARTANLQFLLAWLDYYYGDLFDVLLIEQDAAPRLDLARIGAKSYVRHEFIFNPREYNRGWGYNVAVRHFCERSEVVALMDTDVLTGANFVREIIDCHTKYDAVSPYQNIYYTDESEATEVRTSRRLDTLADVRRIKNPVTVSGGIVIFRREVFVALKGFEQYVGYGCEDRALDVTLYNHVDPSRVRIAPETYAHLYHPSDEGARSRFEQIYDHLVTNYGCRYEPSLGPFDFIHQKCKHASRATTLRLMIERAESFGDIDLYRRDREPSVNGIVARRAAPVRVTEDTILPPDFTSLDAYERKEIYETAPLPDSEELAAFYNAFRGKRCFIIGNGPSLNKHDLSLLKDEYSFGVNSFYYKTRETGFRPYFYVVEDSSVMKENIEEIRRFDAPFKLFPTNYRSLHPKQPNTFFFRMNRGFYEKSSPNFVVPRFSTDASKVLYCGQSVTYINLQLAHFMGFTEVYLIGMDFSYVIPDSHKRTGDVLLSDTDDPNHFHKDYFGKGKTWKDPKLDRVALNYRMAKLVYESTGRRIYNATVGGSLEVFERVDYAGLFGRPAVRGNGPLVQFSEANALYRDKRYAEALSAYVALAHHDGGMFLYKRSAVDAFMRANEAHQSCLPGDIAFVRGLMFNL